MKYKLILLFGLLFTSAVFSQTTNELGLKGKVKSVVENYQKCPMVAVKGSTFKCNERTSTYEFNKDGTQITSEQKSIPNQYITEKIITKEGYTVVKYLEWDDEKRKHFEEFYNIKGLLLKILNFHADGEITNIWEYVYNKKGLKTEQKVTNFWNNTKTVYHHWFNKYGDIVLSKEYKNDVLVNEESFEINYSFDKKGNWITKYLSGDYNETYKREIQYY